MYRTVKKSFVSRLISQANEAELQGLTKIASKLTKQVEQNVSNVRENDSFYRYSSAEFNEDVEDVLWQAVIRVADFYDLRRVDGRTIQTLVERTSQELIQELCRNAGINHGIGVYESPVPGENSVDTILQVEDDE